MSTQTKRAAPPPPSSSSSPVAESPPPPPHRLRRRSHLNTRLLRGYSELTASQERAQHEQNEADSPSLSQRSHMEPPRANNGSSSSRKRKPRPPHPAAGAGGGLGDLHDDMLERVLVRLPPAAYFRLRAVCRRWSAAAASPTFLDACARVPSRDPWFLMLSDSSPGSAPVAFDAAGRTWNRRCRAAPGNEDAAAVPVAASGGLVLYRAPDTGALTVANPLTGASRALPSPPPLQQLKAIAMYGAGHHYRVALFAGDLPDLSMAVYDSSANSWEGPMPLARKAADSSSSGHPGDAAARGGGAADDDDDTVYFLSKSGDVVSTNMQRSASKQYSSVVVPSPSPAAPGDAVAYFLSYSGTVVACDTARRTFAELPRILPVYFEYSIDVVACGGAAYAVVLSEYLDTASLRVWEFAAGAWRQVAAMPPAMSHGFHGARADINCVGHGDRLMVCVASAEAASACFMCDVATNQWEELPKYVNGDGEADEFLAAFSFEPRVEITV